MLNTLVLLLKCGAKEHFTCTSVRDGHTIHFNEIQSASNMQMMCCESH